MNLDFARNIKHEYFKRRPLWTIGLYRVQRESDIFELERREPFAFIGEHGIRLSSEYQSTVADPFLLPYEGNVYIFYEIKTDFGVGEIHAASIDENGVRERYGRVLKETFHLSYPQVFIYEDQVWMIPETASDKKVWLYRCTKFPKNWIRERILIDEEIVDPSLIINRDGFFILGTTRRPELRLFWSPTLEDGFRDAGISISRDLSVVRNAGKPFRVDGRLYRPAQNCEKIYGENINVLEVTDLTDKSYSETLVVRDLFKTKLEWMALGCHHLSIARFRGEFVVAVDGMRPDRLINSLTLAFLGG